MFTDLKVSMKAVGSIDDNDLKRGEKVFFNHESIGVHEQLKKPSTSDWLFTHSEPGQTFDQFKTGKVKLPSTLNLVIVPIKFIEDAEEIPSFLLTSLQKFAACFFQVNIIVKNYQIMTTESRKNELTKAAQFNARQAMERLSTIKSQNPKDKAHALIGVTLSDIYPRDDWNYVFGLANSNTRVGIFSMARYFEEFPSLPADLNSVSSDASSMLLERMCKVMCHEFCHMFGMSHCIFFNCLMNGSNHLGESDGKSLFLCPVCLRKLHFVIPFPIRKRFEDLLNFWEGSNEKHAEWIRRKLAIK